MGLFLLFCACVHMCVGIVLGKLKFWSFWRGVSKALFYTGLVFEASWSVSRLKDFGCMCK